MMNTDQLKEKIKKSSYLPTEAKDFLINEKIPILESYLEQGNFISIMASKKIIELSSMPLKEFEEISLCEYEENNLPLILGIS